MNKIATLRTNETAVRVATPPLVTLRGVDKVFANEVTALKGLDLDIQGGRVSLPARAFRLRKVHGPAAAVGTDRADARRDYLADEMSGTRLRVSGADADAMVRRVHQRLAAAASRRRVEGKGPAARRRGAGAGWARRLRQGLPAPAVRRDEDAGVDRPRPGDPADGPVDGRAVRRPRRDHPPQAQRRSGGAAVGARGDSRVRDPFGVRERLSFGPDRGDGGAAGTRGRGNHGRSADRVAPGGVPAVQGVRRHLRPNFGGAPCRDGRQAAEDARGRRCRESRRLRRLRGSGPDAGSGAVRLGGAGPLFRRPVLSLAGAEPHHRHPHHRLADALGLALGDAVDYAQGAPDRRHRQRRRWLLFSPSRGSSSARSIRSRSPCR